MQCSVSYFNFDRTRTLILLGHDDRWQSDVKVYLIKWLPGFVKVGGGPGLEVMLQSDQSSPARSRESPSGAPGLEQTNVQGPLLLSRV